MHILFALLVASFMGGVLTGCANKEQLMNGDNVIISKPGLYEVSRLKCLIHVEITAEHLVRYRVSDALNRSLITSVERFSAGQRWCLFWDQKDRLWVQSSDVGTFLWQKTESGDYRQSEVSNDKSLVRQMPAKVFASLPNAMKKRWSDYRQTKDD